MNDNPADRFSDRQLGLMAAVGLTMLWLAQPPIALWPLALVALVPWLSLIIDQRVITRRGYLILWAASTIYWLLSLQGLRHAHPVMYACWIALSGYLALYHTLFIGLAKRFVSQGIPLVVAAPVVWVGQELVRNYLLTGISAAMLGHTMADVPVMIQIADMLGTYGVGCVLVVLNVAACLMWRVLRCEQSWKPYVVSWIFSASLLVGTIGYGVYRIGEPLGKPLATFALVQRAEPVVYEQSLEREAEIFQNYARQSIETVRTSSKPIDAIVWPESMFTGGVPWITAVDDAAVPEEAGVTPSEFQELIRERQQHFVGRSKYLQNLVAAETSGRRPADLLAGCSVVHYADSQQVYSAVIHVDPEGRVADWYGKTHLVMFGEYVPIAPWIPGLRSLIPAGMGINTGDGAKRMNIAQTAVAANICIETAVERVTVNQIASLHSKSQTPEVIVTVTNDGWFDESSVIEHHLRCAQLVAVGCRRPILSAANNGPTAWIDSRGTIVERLPTGSQGAVVATPRRDDRISIYVRIGDWPARICAGLCLLGLAIRRISLLLGYVG